MLGWGRLTFLSADGQSIALSLKYEIHPDGFRFVVLSDSGPRNATQTFAEIFSQLPSMTSGSVPTYSGSAVLAGLPASPADAFYGVTLSYQADQLSLTIASPTDQLFAQSPHGSTAFKNLQLTFTQTTANAEIAVSGTVVAVVLGVDIGLTAGMNATPSGDRQLLFTKTVGDPVATVPIEAWGTLDIDALTVQPATINWDGLQAMYTFDEGRGDRIYDCVASDAPIDMMVLTPNTVTWGDGQIAVDERSLISSSDRDGDPDRSGRQSSASRLIAACTDTEALTIAAWIQPKLAVQGGPARIVALSKDTGNRHFMLGQGIHSGEDGASDQYRVRFRTDEFTKGDPGVTSTLGSVTADLTYVAYTRSAIADLGSGRDRHNDDDDDDENNGINHTSIHNAHLYINGRLNTSEPIPGDLDGGGTWHDHSSYELVMGNVASALDERDKDRSWLGSLHRVALYNRALEPDEIYRQYHPTVFAGGTFRLNTPPNPLDQSFPAELSLEFNGNGNLQLRVKQTAQEMADPLTVTSQFQFTALDLLFYRDLNAGETTFSLADGEIQATLWGNAVTFAVSGESTDQGPWFVLQSPPVDLEVARTSDMLSDIDLKLDGLNTLTFNSITVESLLPPTGTVPWRTSSTTDMQEVILPRSRDGRPFDWTVDFKLLSPSLAIADEKIKLQGTWLDQPLALFGWWRNGQFVLQGDSQFSLPFQLQLGPIVAPGTTEVIVEQAVIQSVMETTLTLELTKLGFLAQVASRFTWTDAASTTHTFTVPTFPLSWPPLTPNQILSAVLEQFRANANAIFEAQFSHAQDYFFTVVGQMPLMYLGDRASSPDQVQTTTLPQLFSSIADANSVTSGAFSLIQSSTSCTLAIAPTGATAADISALEADYQTFLTLLESRTTGLIPGALNLVKTRIAERLPMTIDRILYYYYGLDMTNGAVDLQGGMRLRVDYQNYQFVHPADKSANAGFVSSGSAYYHLNSSLAPTSNGISSQLSFDPFLLTIQPFVQSDIATLGASGIIDVFGAGYEQPYFRLIYPSQLNEVAGQGTERVATLVGAPTLTTLNTATGNFQDSGVVPTTGTDLNVFHFRGRATVIPEIAVFVQGQPVFVPLGTTLRQLCEQSVGVPAALPSQSLSRYTGLPRFSRILHEGISSEPSCRFVNLDPRLFDLPLVKGDRVSF